MYALSFDIIPSTLFSIRQPTSFQSALAYPLPPPSTLKGLLANAFQQYQRIPPSVSLNDIESKIINCYAKTRDPISISSANLRLRVYDKNTWRGDALPRQFAHSRCIHSTALSDDIIFFRKLGEALKGSTLYLGDSESLITVSNIRLENVGRSFSAAGTIIETSFYAPARLFKEIYSEAIIYWVFEKTSKQEKLIEYVFPLKMIGYRFEPIIIRGKLAKGVRGVIVDGNLIVAPS